MINHYGNQREPAVRGFIDHHGHRYVEIKYERGAALLEYREFAGEQRTIWSKLADQGVILVGRALRADLIEQVEELTSFKERVIFSRPGWCRGQFANAAGKVFAPRGVEKGLVAFAPNPTKCATNGDLEGWKLEVGEPVMAHQIPAFFMMIPFAAPMLELVERGDNFGFELSGPGGKGKSLTQRFMASTSGPAMEKDRGYITTFYMTPTALEKSMAVHSDSTFIIDEANLFGSGSGGRADRRKMRDFSFQMSSGTTKGRCDTPEQDGYRFIYVTSANEPFHLLLGDAHQDVANAASDRLISIVVLEGDAGVFGPLPSGYQNYRPFTLELEKAMTRHYGIAMPSFLRALVRARHRDEDRLKRRIRRLIDKFTKAIGVNMDNGSDVRVAEAFGLVYAAGVLARKWNVIPSDFDCLGAALHCYANFRSSVPTRQSLTERVQAIAAMPTTLTIHRDDLQKMSDKKLDAAGAFIRVVKGELILLMTPHFGRKMFPDWDALKGTDEFIALNRADRNARGRGYHCRVRSNSSTDWFYAFRLPSDATQS